MDERRDEDKKKKKRENLDLFLGQMGARAARKKKIKKGKI